MSAAVHAARSLALPAAGLVAVMATAALSGVGGWLSNALEALRLFLSRGRAA